MSALKAAAAKIKAATEDREKRLEARVAARTSATGTLVVLPARVKVKMGTTIYTSGSKSSKR